MAQYRISGKAVLRGSVRAAGNKNSILKLLPATLLTNETCILENVPIIRDVESIAKILIQLGADIKGLGTHTLTINTANVSTHRLDPNLVSEIRASIVFLGPMLARFGKVELRHPGGDIIGKRAVGTHFDALRAIGAQINTSGQVYKGSISNFGDAEVFLDEASVTATENAMILASKIPHLTVIEDAACEPHIGCLASFLTKMGARIEGAGTNKITIHGKRELSGAKHTVATDHIEVGTYAIAAAATGGEVTILNAVKRDMRMTLLYLARLGVKYVWIDESSLKILPSSLEVSDETLYLKQKFQVRPWPGFPTDLMSPFIVLATQSRGNILCHDWMYETRMFFVDKLIRMGANITICDPHRIIINGPTPLYAKHLPSPDIRAGIALVVAALCAQGASVIDHIEHIERGYEDLETKLKSLGASIARQETQD